MSLDRLKESIAQVVKALLPPIDYLYALQPCKVIKQDSDGTLQLRPDNPNLSDLAGVPIRYGIPGVRATVSNGARVLLGFENGNPQRPVAHLWESASVTKLEVNATEVVFNGGNKKVARKDDSVSLGTLTALVPLPSALTPTAVVFTHIPPSGVPSPADPILDLTGGKITDGANGVKA